MFHSWTKLWLLLPSTSFPSAAEKIDFSAVTKVGKEHYSPHTDLFKNGMAILDGKEILEIDLLVKKIDM